MLLLRNIKLILFELILLSRFIPLTYSFLFNKLYAIGIRDLFLS